MDKSLSPRERAEKLVAAMTLEQKIAQLHGAMKTINIYALPSGDEMNAMSAEEQDKLMAQIQVQRHVKGIEELGIPRFRITNGPVGVGMGDGHPSPAATALPMSIALAAGFDPSLHVSTETSLVLRLRRLANMYLKDRAFVYIELRLLAVTLNISQKIHTFPG